MSPRVKSQALFLSPAQEEDNDFDHELWAPAFIRTAKNLAELKTQISLLFVFFCSIQCSFPKIVF